MRRLLPIVLLLAIAGLLALVLVRHSGTGALPASPRAGSDAPTPDRPIESELATQPDAREARSDAAPQPAAAPAPESKETATVLVVHAIGKSDRAPLAGVRVFVSKKVPEPGNSGADFVPGPKGDLRKAPISGKDGLVELRLPPHVEFWMSAEVEDGSAGSMQTDIAALQSGERRELVVEIPQGNDARMIGKVVSADSGAGIAGARVVLVQADMVYSGATEAEWKLQEFARATTDTKGSFDLPFPSWKRLHLRVEADGYGLRLLPAGKGSEDPQHPRIVKLYRSSTVSAHVIDSAGKGLVGVSVVLIAQGNALQRADPADLGLFTGEFLLLPNEQWKHETGADGRATFEGLPARVGLAVDVLDHEKVLLHEIAEFMLSPGETREMEWRIGAGTRVNGLVLDQENQPVKGQELWLARAGSATGHYFNRFEGTRIPRRVETDQSGRFVLDDLLAGRWWIGPAAQLEDRVAPDPKRVAPFAEVLEIAGEPARDLTLHVTRGLYIRGTVIDPAGAPVADLHVNGQGAESVGWCDARSATDGSFAFGPLVPGLFTLTADAQGSLTFSDSVEARAGSTGVILRLKPGCKLHGHVVDDASGAACPAQLTLTPEQPGSGPLGNGWSTSSQSDGSFAFDGLLPARYRIIAMSADGRFAQQLGLDLGAGSESGDIVLALKPGGTLRLTYKGSESPALVVIRCGGAPINFGEALEAGRSRELFAPAGSLVLELKHFSKGPTRQVKTELGPGETKEIVLTDQD